MADDTPTVEAATADLVHTIKSLAADIRRDRAAALSIPTAQIDALIAAVRAETQEELTFQWMHGRPSPELLARLKRESS